jgi:8-oxo-dGTP diphosphatase
MSKKEYVVGFLFDDHHTQVALVRKNKPEWQAGLWNGIGGKREGDEPWDEAMTREFHEETGVHIAAEGWQHTVTLFNDWFELRVFRAFSDQVADVRTMEEEEIAAVPLTDLASLPTIPNLRWLVPLQLDRGLHFPLSPFKDG